MEELVKTFHIDAKLVIAQLVNFFIVLAVLYRFAYKPILKLLNDRSATIEKSLGDAKRIEQRLADQEEEYKAAIVKARKEAGILLEKAAEQGEEKRQAMLVKAKEEIGQIINKEKEKMMADKAQTLKEIKKEVAELVGAALEKLVDKKVTSKDDQEIIKQLIKGEK